MTVTREGDQKQCEGNIPYPTGLAARLSKQSGQQVYNCRWCGMFHVKQREDGQTANEAALQVVWEDGWRAALDGQPIHANPFNAHAKAWADRWVIGWHDGTSVWTVLRAMWTGGQLRLDQGGDRATLRAMGEPRAVDVEVATVKILLGCKLVERVGKTWQSGDKYLQARVTDMGLQLIGQPTKGEQVALEVTNDQRKVRR